MSLPSRKEAPDTGEDRAAAPPTTTTTGAARLWAKTVEEYDCFLRLSQSSRGEPTWFAIPVDASDDGDHYVLVLEIGSDRLNEVYAYGGEQNVLVLGALGPQGRRERRVCPFPEPVDPKSIETSRVGATMTVRIRKRNAKS